MTDGGHPWALPVFCISEFFRVVTHPRIFGNPHTPSEAVEALERLLGFPALRVLFPGDRFLPILQEIVRKYEIRGNLVYDAQIVALCRESGTESILTDDRDFDRFKEIRSLKLG